MAAGPLARRASARNSQLLFGRIVISGDWDVASGVAPASAQDGQFWKATSAGSFGGATIPNGALCLFSENLTVVHFLPQEAAEGGGGATLIPWDMTPATAPAPACAYPLNMTQAQAIALDYQDVMSVTGQEASYVIRGGVESYYDVVTGSDQTSPQLIDTTTGKKTILFKFVAPFISPEVGAPSAVAIHGAITDFSGDGSVQIGIGVSDSTTRTVDIYNNFNAVFSDTGVSETSYFSMCFDSETSTVYIYNGASPVYAGAYVPKADVQLEVAASENITLYEPDIGKTYTFEVFTSASDIMSAPEVPSYPSGATDICGNPLSGSSAGDADLPLDATAGSLLEVKVAGTYDTVPYSVGDVAVVLTDGTTVQKLAPESGAAVTSVNGQTGDVVITSPVTSVNGQTGDVYISTPPATTIDGVSGTIVTKKKPAAFGMVFNTHYTLNGFTERHVLGAPAYSFSPKLNQGGGIAVPKISADASWGLFRASRYISNNTFVDELFAVDLFTGITTRVYAGTGWQTFSAVASADGTTIYAGTTQGGEATSFRRNADGSYTRLGGFNTRYLNTANRRVIRSSDTQLGQATPTYIYAGYTPSAPSNVIIRANVSDLATTPIAISALADVKNFSVSPDSDHIFAKAADGSVWMGKADGVTTVALPVSITGTVLDAVFQRPGLHQSRINAYKMAVRWDDAGTIKLSIVDFEIGYGGGQNISSYTHYVVDPGDLLSGGGFSVCGTYVSGENKVIDILTGTEVLYQGGEWIG